MVAEPGATLATRPLLFTLATDALLLEQEIERPERTLPAESGVVAVSCSQTDRGTGIGDSEWFLAAEGRESHDEPRILQQGQSTRQLMLECHDTVLLSTRVCETTKSPTRLVVRSATT